MWNAERDVEKPAYWEFLKQNGWGAMVWYEEVGGRVYEWWLENLYDRDALIGEVIP